jgi:2-polyprenyl-6-hydroxyphenyl methylase/3-demethylubiquinone-9 3-methyltransferase
MDHSSEIRRGLRFEFGKNWSKFLRILDDHRVADAEKSLRDMLNVETLSGKSFLDVGSGSGLFSLAARRMGAVVHSFDYDPQSVACTSELRRIYFPDDQNWSVNEANVLDISYLRGLGQFDLVYSWGVLHHTGAMWTALDNLSAMVTPGGKLFIAIYNDQGLASKYWLLIKKCYAKHKIMRIPILSAHIAYPLLPSLIYRSLFGKRGNQRGMSPWRDLVDWVGGYPYEYASSESIFDFYYDRGFCLEKLITTNRHGCNQFVFVKAN